MSIFTLYWRLLRYRVAVMIALFMLLGAAWQCDVNALGCAAYAAAGQTWL